MHVPKTAERIAERMRRRGFDDQAVEWLPDGLYGVTAEGETAGHRGGPAYLLTKGDTALEAYREIERRWHEEFGEQTTETP